MEEKKQVSPIWVFIIAGVISALIGPLCFYLGTQMVKDPSEGTNNSVVNNNNNNTDNNTLDDSENDLLGIFGYKMKDDVLYDKQSNKVVYSFKDKFVNDTDYHYSYVKVVGNQNAIYFDVYINCHGGIPSEYCKSRYRLNQYFQEIDFGAILEDGNYLTAVGKNNSIKIYNNAGKQIKESQTFDELYGYYEGYILALQNNRLLIVDNDGKTLFEVATLLSNLTFCSASYNNGKFYIQIEDSNVENDITGHCNVYIYDLNTQKLTITQVQYCNSY